MADLNETQKVARQASQLQSAERNADSMLTKGLGEAMAMDRVEGTQADMMPDKPEMRSPAANPQGVEGTFDPKVGSPLSQENVEPPFDTQKAEFLTRDRPQLNLPDMSPEELMQARQRLMQAMEEEQPGQQKEAFTVLLNRIESALEGASE